MPDFDPYHRWLGIPPDERPISKYRLLGIAEFEQDKEIINSASLRQTKHLRTMQAGEHESLVAQLLNEVSYQSLHRYATHMCPNYCDSRASSVSLASSKLRLA